MTHEEASKQALLRGERTAALVMAILAVAEALQGIHAHLETRTIAIQDVDRR